MLKVMSLGRTLLRRNRSIALALLLIMALAIYKNFRYIWLIIPLTVFWSNVHGGYIYVFLMMVPFIGILKTRLISGQS